MENQQKHEKPQKKEHRKTHTKNTPTNLTCHLRHEMVGQISELCHMGCRGSCLPALILDQWLQKPQQVPRAALLQKSFDDHRERCNRDVWVHSQTRAVPRHATQETSPDALEPKKLRRNLQNCVIAHFKCLRQYTI